jgi:hypothetical protein
VESATTRLGGQMTMTFTDKNRLLAKCNANPPANAFSIRQLESEA